MKVDLFDFDLPKNLIANKSQDPRDSAKMLAINGNSYLDKKISDLSDIFSEGDIFVVNNTKVIPSRIKLKLNKFSSIEITFLNELKKGIWRTLVRPSKKLNIGDKLLYLNKYIFNLVDKKHNGEVLFQVNMNTSSFLNLLYSNGSMPLPPYLRNNIMKNPYKDYQTIFASQYGAVAAPTAGLHFTNHLINKIKKKNIFLEQITLHVGSGTFLPIKVDDTDTHIMHKEYFEISKKSANKINCAKSKGGKIIAVGTTVLRALESALSGNGTIIPKKGYTDIFITPNSKIISSDYLLTNFHLPKSTLFVLVCGYAGIENMHNAYRHAIKKEYRFYSLGDACLIKKET